MFTEDLTLGEIAKSIPGATAVFRQHKLDFCCGGDQTLTQAAAKKGVDVTAVSAELEQLIRNDVNMDWDLVDDEQLIEHILSRYHDVHRQQLPELIRMAGRVELVHGGHAQCPAGLTFQLEKMKANLEEHMRKEEQVLFPMITRDLHRLAVQPVAIMRNEHHSHGEELAELTRITRGFTTPENACSTWQALYTGLDILCQDLMEHIHLENNILFSRVDQPG